MNKIFVDRERPSHPWIFSNEIVSKDKSINAGDIVDIYRGPKFIGKGFYNPKSLIAVRKYSLFEEFNCDFVKKILLKALLNRKNILKDDSFRLLFSESDGIPGLIIDKYNNHYVMQIHCYGIDIRKDLIITAIHSLNPLSIYEKSEHSFRNLEGLEDKNGIIYGSLDKFIKIEQDGIKFLVDIANGQKTGFFFDLRDIRRKVQEISNNKSVLDLFCYSGGFSLYAAKGGASQTTGIDSSKSALEIAEENAKINEVNNVRYELADVFDFLRGNKEKFDIIILDPPSFTRTKKEVNDARRGYKELNIQAMKHLNKNGILFTSCCSYHFTRDDFLKIISDSAVDVEMNFIILNEMKQSQDHPILLGMPESYYLKCFMLQRA